MGLKQRLQDQYAWKYRGPALGMTLVFNCAVYWFSASLGPMKSTLLKELRIDNAQYGVITSSGNLINTVIPLISGLAIDYYGAEYMSLLSSAVILLGAIVSGVGASTKNYGALVSGEVVVGLGSISIETAQLKIYTNWCQGSNLGLVYGINNAVNRIILVVAKATAIPIVNGTGWWGWVIWVPAFISFLVLLVNIAYVSFERRLPAPLRQMTGREAAKLHGYGGFIAELKKGLAVVLDLPAIFWIFTLTQGLLSAGYITAIGQAPVVVLAPLVGWFMDRYGYRMHFVPVSAVFFIIVFVLTGFATSTSAIVLTILLGFGLAFNFLPFTISIPLMVTNLAYIGTAQGAFQAFINSGHVIIVTSTGAIQDRSPPGKHSYDNVFYFFFALKAFDFFIGLSYVLLDRLRLEGMLSSPARVIKAEREKIDAGEREEYGGWLMQSSKRWTWAGLGVGVAMTVVAWVVYLVYAKGSS
ncbi:MFS transporter [Pseudohyphozyma bogoriensis]|nr:MFS transporter [Pseudohyphozyma bogoriensis]